MSSIQAVRGMNDVLPEQTPTWQQVERSIRALMSAYGYDEIRMPIVESTNLFCRSIGEVTDIVEKEMYTFSDRNGDSLTLRPEGTAQCVRACLEHGLLHHQMPRLWYMGPMFRHERPQKGRYRQFFQLGVEAFGVESPDIDAEQIEMMYRLWREMGIAEHIRLEINTIGSASSRQAYKEALVEYFTRHQNILDEDSQRRLHKNPLRILDSKNPAMAEMIAGAPSFEAYIDDDSKRHFEGLCQRLTDCQIPFRHNPRLVRGLDYYCRTVYEWVTDLLGAQGTVCGGGRYDGLVSELGGKPTPAVGFSVGVERLIALWELQQQTIHKQLDAYVVVLGQLPERQGFQWVKRWRDEDNTLSLFLHCGGGSLKSQMKRADNSHARWALILGEEEVAAGMVTVKYLREDLPQIQVALKGIAQWLRSEKANG